MSEHILKNEVKSQNTVQCKKIAAKNIRTQTVGNTLMQRRNSYLPSEEVVQRQIHYYDTATSKMIEIKNLGEFNRCLHDYGYLQAEENLALEDFPEAERPMVDQAIESLNDDEILTIASAQNAIDLIRRKIGEVIAGNQAQATAADAAEHERIHALAARLNGQWTESDADGGGTYIGNPSKWHIHTDIGTQEHLKYGKHKGGRKSTISYDAITVAIRHLIGEGALSSNSGKECYRWLRYTAITRHGKDLPLELRFDGI